MNRPNSFADLFHSNGNGHAPGPRELAAMRLALNSFMPRTLGGQFARQQSDPRRDVDDEAGYPRMGEPISVELYRGLYEREAIAARVVEVMPQEVWSAQPTVYEDEDANTVTDFEGAWDELGRTLRGEQCWYASEEGSPVWDALQHADEMSGIGHYGLLFIGFDDGQPFATPIGGVLTENRARREVPLTVKKIVTGYTWQENEQKVRLPVPVTNEFNPDPSALYGGGTPTEEAPEKPIPRRKGTKVLYLRAVPEYLAQVVQYEVNPNSPRFGLPVRHMVTFADPRSLAADVNTVGPIMSSQYVHWTRVIHFSENTPRMRPVLNNLLSLRKIYAADGETFFRNCVLKLFLESDIALGGDVNFDAQDLKDKMEPMMNGLQQWMALNGFTAKAIAPAVVDPSPHVQAHLQAIAIKLGMPMRVLMGTERGELAGGQDEDRWDGFVRGYRTRQATPKKIVPFVDRLIATGVLPEPRKKKSGPTTNAPQPAGAGTTKAGGYCVAWPEEESQTPGEKATVALTRTQAMAAYEAGATGMMSRLDYLTREMDYSEEEAASIIDAAKKEADAKAKEEAKAAAEQAAQAPPQPQPGVAAGQPKPQPGEAPAVPGGAFPQPALNAFCPTGEGGGIDPTCAPGGESGSSPYQTTHDKWDAEDTKIDLAYEAATEKLQGRQERENEQTGARQEKEENQWVKDGDKLEVAREREGAAREKAETKEDRELERSREKEDSTIQKERDAEDAAIQKARDSEDRQAEKAGETDEEWQARDDRRSEETIAKEEAREHADGEINARREAEDEALALRRSREEDERDAQRLKEDDAHEALGKAMSNRHDEEAAALSQKHASEQADLDRQLDESRRALYEARAIANPEAHRAFYSDKQHASRGVANANPEGCNQYTGPGCSGQSFDRASLSKEIGTRPTSEIRDIQRRLKLDMTGKKADLLAGMEARGIHSLSGEGGAPSPAAARPLGESIGRLASAFHAHPNAGSNLVGLADLKDATGLSTPDLHAAVQHLRKEGVLSASALEGRHGASAREREAAIFDPSLGGSAGGHLGYVSVKEGQEKRFRAMTHNAEAGLFRRFLRWLTGNEFCPTGPGGGVDATCSPGGGAGAAIEKEHKEGQGPGEGEVAKVHIEDLQFKGGLSEEASPLRDNSHMPIIVKETEDGYKLIDGFGRASGMANAGKETIHAIIVTEGDLKERYKKGGDDEAWNEKMYQRYAPHLTYRATTNTMEGKRCPPP